MAVKTQWAIQFAKCGHAEVKDLSHKRAHERAGFAKWLARKQSCSECFRAAGDGDREEWVAKKHAEEATAAAEWAERFGMPELSGSEKQVAFAARVRYQLMRDLHEWAVQEENITAEAYEQAEEQARRIDAARWWLDNQHHGDDGEPTDPDTLIELLASAAASGDGIACENPA